MFAQEMQAERTWFGNLTESQVAFVRKTYTYLLLALGAFFAASVFAGRNLETFLPYSVPLRWAGFIMLMVSALFRGSRPVSALFLFAFAVITGLGLGPVLTILLHMNPAPVYYAGATTIAIFGTLTAYTLISGADFRYLYGYLFAALIGLIAIWIVGYFVEYSQFWTQAYCYFGALVFTLYILADTSNVTRGYYAADNAAGAALALFLDIINLFLFLLRIFSRK